MLSSFRRKSRTWAVAAILFFSLVAIVITGFGTGGFGGLGSLAGGGGRANRHLGTDVAGAPALHLR